MTEYGTRDHVVEQLEQAKHDARVEDLSALALHLGTAIASALLAIGDDIELLAGPR